MFYDDQIIIRKQEHIGYDDQTTMKEQSKFFMII